MLSRIAVFVSGGGTNLQALIDAQKSGILKSGQIVLVVADAADAYALTRAGFMRILTANFTSKFPERMINVHPALIPSFCGKGFYGLKVHEAALAYGVKVTGATVHYVNEVPDGGKILLQKAVEVLPDDTPERLQRRVMEQAEWILLPQAAEMVSRRLAEQGEKA